MGSPRNERKVLFLDGFGGKLSPSPAKIISKTMASISGMPID
jgi:hypothetical protein